MRTVLARLATTAAALTVAACTLLAAPPASAEDAPLTPIQRLGACLAGGGSGDVLLLIDESASLQTSDPDDDRVTAAQYFVEQLGGYVAQTGADVDVQVAAFAQQYDASTDWVALDAAGVTAIDQEIASFADRDDGAQTDYWTALSGARAALADRATERGAAPSCQAVVWFSDGDLDFTYPYGSNAAGASEARGFAPGVEIVDDASAQEARELAAADLCRPGGLADQLRSTDVIMLGIGLDGQGQGVDFSLMQRTVVGTAGGTQCGDVVDPVPGTFLTAGDLDELLFAFDELSTPGSPPLVQTGPHRVVLDASTSHVTVLASSSLPGAVVTLRSPSGAQLQVPDGAPGAAGSLTLDSAAIGYAWESDRTLSLTIDRAEADLAAWRGLWQLDLTDPAGAGTAPGSRSHIRVQGDLVPAWTNQDTDGLRTGDAVELALGLTDRAGAAFDPALLEGSIEYSATFRDAAGATTAIVTTDDVAELAAVQPLDLGTAALGAGTVTLHSAITTAPTTYEGEAVPGTTLTPETVTIPVTVLAPLDYPTVPASIDFGSVEADAVSLDAVLPVAGEGCVRLTGDVEVVASPAEIGDVVRITSADGCLPAGDVPLTLATDASGNGAISGSFTVLLEPATDGEPIQATVAFTAEVQRPLDAGVLGLTFLLALLAAIGIPLLLLYLLKRATSTIPKGILYAFVVDVTVTDAGVLRDRAPFAIRTEDQSRLVSVRKGARRLPVDDVTLVVRTGWSPFGRGRVVVRAPGLASVSSATPSTDRSRLRAVLPLAVHNHWVLLRAPGSPADRARLLVLLGSHDETTTTRFTQSLDKAPERLRRLIDAEPSAPGGQDSATDSPPAPSAPLLSDPFAVDAAAPPSTGQQAPRPVDPFAGDPFAADPWSTPPTDGDARR